MVYASSSPRWPLILALVLPAVAGCSFKGGLPPLLPGTGAADKVWQIHPVRLRVYPSTAYAGQGKDTTLDTRIELFDEAGDSCKGVGIFRFELYAHPRAGEPALGPRLYAWEVPVLTLDQNRRQYDSITRTYLFHLRLDGPAPTSPLLLTVTFVPAGSATRLETHAILTPSGVRSPDSDG